MQCNAKRGLPGLLICAKILSGLLSVVYIFEWACVEKCRQRSSCLPGLPSEPQPNKILSNFSSGLQACDADTALTLCGSECGCLRTAGQPAQQILSAAIHQRRLAAMTGNMVEKRAILVRRGEACRGFDPPLQPHSWWALALCCSGAGGGGVKGVGGDAFCRRCYCSFMKSLSCGQSVRRSIWTHRRCSSLCCRTTLPCWYIACHRKPAQPPTSNLSLSCVHQDVLQGRLHKI